MSGGLDILSMKEDDVTKMLAAGVHLGDPNVNFQMEQYVYKKRPDGTAIINLRKTWEKLVLAARVIAAVENPADICLISNGNFGQRAILKFAKHTGAVAVAGRFTPGTFTNQIQKAFREPRLLVVSDPIADHQPITEASYVNIPTIAFCNTNSPLRHIDIAVPCNGHGKYSQGLMWYMLCREVLRLKGLISRDIPWDVVPDLFFYRDPEEVEKEEQAKQEQQLEQGQDWQSTAPAKDQWVDTTGPSDWGAESFPVTQLPPPTTAQPAPAGGAGEDWAIDLVQSTTTKDWGADEDTGDWGGTSTVTQGTW